MSKRFTEHATFTIERTFTFSPAKVFGAWVDPAAKALWYVGPDGWINAGHELNFRVGGKEHIDISQPGGPSYSFNFYYKDIVPNKRIVYMYSVDQEERRISVSLATVEFLSADSGTRLIYTEQAVFLDGGDKPETREQGTRELLDKLENLLRQS